MSRDDICTRCGQPGHTASSCKVKLPPVLRFTIAAVVSFLCAYMAFGLCLATKVCR